MAGEDALRDWPREPIPDADALYMRVHDMWWRNGAIIPRAFSNHGDAMSTDWEKYATPQQTRARGRNPHRNAVVSMNVGSVRAIPGQHVEHTPDAASGNRAHTDVRGEKDEEARVKLRRIATVVIPLENNTGRQ